MEKIRKEIKQLKELKKIKKDMRLAAEGWNKDWKTLIATMLSARTRDEKTIEVCNVLFKRYNSLRKLSDAKISEVEKIIRPVNFYKNKSKNVINCCIKLIDLHKKKVPLEFEKLVNLDGVGRKTANVFLAVSGKPEIGVDTHVTYISKKLGWSNGKNQKQIEKDLKKIFPKNKWKEINYILVGFGRTIKSKKRKDEILNKIKNLS
jgi:endonuclease III